MLIRKRSQECPNCIAMTSDPSLSCCRSESNVSDKSNVNDESNVSNVNDECNVNDESNVNDGSNVNNVRNHLHSYIFMEVEFDKSSDSDSEYSGSDCYDNNSDYSVSTIPHRKWNSLVPAQEGATGHDNCLSLVCEQTLHGGAIRLVFATVEHCGRKI